jgi:hypothetical protein
MQAASLEVLEKAGVASPQARAFAQAIEIELDARRDTLATKLDLRELRLELKGDMHALRAEIVRWVFLVILGQTVVLTGVGYFFVEQLAR